MNFSTPFFIGVNGLFDFDLTFPTEAFLFLLLAIVVTFGFIAPVSTQLEERATFIDYNLRKSTILITFGYDKLSKCVGLLNEEIEELNRQLKLLRIYTNSKFEAEIEIVQKENIRILSKLKGNLAIQSAYLFSTFEEDLTSLTDIFFKKKFQS